MADDEINDRDAEYWLRDREDGDGTHYAEDDDAEEGCCFPDKCCMPGPHLRSECCTAEMMQDFEREATAGKTTSQMRESR